MQIRPSALYSSFFTLAAIAIAFASASTCFAGAAPQAKGKAYSIGIDFAKGAQAHIVGEYEYEGEVIVIPETPETAGKPKPQKTKELPMRVSALSLIHI